jgi:hypothetical protein
MLRDPSGMLAFWMLRYRERYPSRMLPTGMLRERYRYAI